MFLQRLEIQGFKSFAEKTTLEFNRELTSVVGPNGSGKSNIADAIRWVLGEQSIKILRGKKAQDVIFAGSDKKTRLGLAEVNLFLDNTSGTAPIDYSQIMVTRRIYRNGESEYLINKNQVRLQDVLLLLAKANFGQRSFSIIGQGLIDHILVSTPQERKEFFDEATGVRQYQIKREQSVNKLIRTEENLKQAESLLNEINPHLRSLTRQVRRLERRAEIEQQLIVWQQSYYSQLWREINGELAAKRTALAKQEATEREIKNKISGLQKRLESFEQASSRQQEFTALQSVYQALIDRKNSLLREQAVLAGQRDLELVKIGKQNLTYLQKQQEELTGRFGVVEQRIKASQQELAEATGHLASRAKEQAKVLAEFTALEKQLQTAKEKLERSEVLPFSEIKERVIKIKSLSRNLIEQLSQVKDLNSLKAICSEASDIQVEIEAFHRRLERSDSPEVSQQVIALQQRLNEFIRGRDNLVNEVNQSKIKAEIARGRIESLAREAAGLTEQLEKISREIKKAGLSPADAKQLTVLLKQEAEELKRQLAALEQELQAAEKKLKDFNLDQENKQSEVFALQKQLRDYQLNMSRLINELNEVKVAAAKLETRQEDLEREIADELGGKFDQRKDYPPLEQQPPAAKEEIFKLKNQLALIGGIDQAVVAEHKEVKGRFDFLNTQVKDLRTAINSLEQVISELDITIKKQFTETFNRINKNFSEYFQVLFSGGRAKLVLWEEEDKKAKGKGQKENDEEGMEVAEAVAAVESDEAEEEEEEGKKLYQTRLKRFGVDIDACPPGKKLKGVSMLSGGERAMTSIALICAIISNNPSPFVVLDEVDAALDEANSIRFADIIDELAHKTQFIMITHNRATMHKASVLYGVTMGDDGVSKLLSISLKEAEEKYSSE